MRRLEGEAPKFHTGQYVKLKEFDNGDELVPEELGHVTGIEWVSPTEFSGLYLIQLDDEFISKDPEDGDDGMREVEEEQLEAEK